VCHKHPNIGWLYRCTQDTNGCLPESDFTSDVAAEDKRRDSQHIDLNTLSLTTIRAISQGEYTKDQIKILLAQKQKVKEVVLGQGTRPTTSSTAASASTYTSTIDSTNATYSTLPPSTTFSTTSSTSLDEEIRAAYDWKELQKVWMSEPAIPRTETIAGFVASIAIDKPLKDAPQPADRRWPLPKAIMPIQEKCDFKICPTCRPTYRERAYQSLNNILNNPLQLPPIWELENRRVSDAHVVARIRFPAPPRFYAQAGHDAVQSRNSIPIILEAPPEETEVVHQEHDTHSVRKRSGFRKTVRRALARARNEESSESSEAEPDEIFHTATSRQSRSFVFRRPRSRPTLSYVERHGQLVDTSGLQESVLLMLATNTPLPNTPVAIGDYMSQISNANLQFIRDGIHLRAAGMNAHP
jgi:hypothetical protein